MKPAPELPLTSDVKRNIMAFRKKTKRSLRYASYDFCFFHFYTNKGHLTEDTHRSCFILWSYLASWGMLRNSRLLECSPAALEPLIFYFDKDLTPWDIDVKDYNDGHKRKKLIKVYSDIANILRKKVFGKISKAPTGKDDIPTITLVTKIMLGVYGNIPAFDQYFKNTFHDIFGGFSSSRQMGEKEILALYKFYTNYRKLLDMQLSPKMSVINFEGVEQNLHYTIAKLIDMYGFTNGLKDAKITKENSKQ